MGNKEDGIFEKTIKKTKLALKTKPKFHSKASMSSINGGDADHDDDGMDVELKAILWHQGESDCGSLENANHYLSASLLLFESFREELGDNIPIIVGGLADFLGKNNTNNFIYYNIINSALIQLPQRLHNVAFVSSNNLNHKGDWLHFDSDSCVILGQRYAAKYAKLSGSLTNEELNKYIRFKKFKNVLKKHGSKAYEKTKGITFRTWFIGIASITFAIYAYKRYYSPSNEDVNNNNNSK